MVESNLTLRMLVQNCTRDLTHCRHCLIVSPVLVWDWAASSQCHHMGNSGGHMQCTHSQDEEREFNYVLVNCVSNRKANYLSQILYKP